MMDKKYLCIRSRGEIDPLAFTLLGGTTKRDDATKIGMFGSGLKYSISSLIRNGIEFKVFSGEKELKFELKETKFRDQNFQVIYINGKETSLTTNMGGSDWDTPFAPLREIYSNALDEDDQATLRAGTIAEGVAGYTSFYIQHSREVADFYLNRSKYFLQGNSNVLTANRWGAIYPNPETTIRLFRKGILAYSQSHTKTKWMYNSAGFEINESRVVSNYYQCEKVVSNIWKECQVEELIYELLTHLDGANIGSLERELDWDRTYYGSAIKGGQATFSDAWSRVVYKIKFVALEHMSMFTQNELANRFRIKLQLLLELKKQFPDMDILGLSDNDDVGGHFNIVDPPMELFDKVVDAIEKLKQTDYAKRFNQLQIEYVRFAKASTFALAKRGKIYLSVKLIDWDVDEIARVLIEENEHNLTDLDDESREFQNHLFRLYYNQLIRNI